MNQKEAFEYVIGSLFIDALLWGLFLLLSMDEISFISWLCAGFGIVAGFLYSKREFQEWPSFVIWLTMNETRRQTIADYVFYVILVLVLMFGYPLVSQYVDKRVISAFPQIMIGSSMGYYLWPLWLHHGLSKIVKSG